MQRQGPVETDGDEKPEEKKQGVQNLMDEALTALVKDVVSHARTTQGLLLELRSCSEVIVERVINDHHTPALIALIRLGQCRSVLKAEFGSTCLTTRREIEWYQRFAARYHSFVPQLWYAFQGTYGAALLLDHIDEASTLDDLALVQQEVRSFMQEVRYHVDEIFADHPVVRLSEAEMQQWYVEKYIRRLKEARRFPVLQTLLECEHVVINDRDYLNIPQQMEWLIRHKRLASVTPTLAGQIHGDLHFGNVLCQGSRVFLIDPKAVSPMPIEYDYGKIFQSIHGGYGVIKAGLCQVTTRGRDFSLMVEVPEGYRQYFDELTRVMPEAFLVRCLYTEALHFITMLPHHASDERETVALYLRAVQLLNHVKGML